MDSSGPRARVSSSPGKLGPAAGTAERRGGRAEGALKRLAALKAWGKAY